MTFNCFQKLIGNLAVASKILFLTPLGSGNYSEMYIFAFEEIPWKSQLNEAE